MAEQKKLTRRSLFAGVGAVVAAGAAAKLSQNSAGIASAVKPVQPAAGDGYRLSEHVKKYYRTTTI
jgi:hypothetical protein